MGQQMNIDNAKFATQSMQDNANTVKAMKATATVLKKQLQEDINIDEVEDLQDEMMDLMDDANEINDILGEAWGMDDFDDELDDLDMNEDDVPSYMVSANAAANKNELQEDTGNVDEYGLDDELDDLD